MRVKAVDTVHISNIRLEPFIAGEKFKIADDEGRRLVARGLVREIKGSDRSGAKKAPEPNNKKAPQPNNKAGGAGGAAPAGGAPVGGGAGQ